MSEGDAGAGVVGARPLAASDGVADVGIEVVVVAYGPPDLLDRALRPLERRYRVTVVDNSSSSETRAVVERHGARYVDPGENLGFARAVNLALRSRSAGADVLLLNPDASIAPAGIEQLRSVLRDDPSAACVAPSQHAPGSSTAVQVCWPFPSPIRAWVEAVGCARFQSGWDFVIGSVLLLRSEAIDDVGEFDERFFLYAEETDWQLRATRRGWTILFARDVEAEHMGAGTGGDPTAREMRFHASHERFVRKWYGNEGWQLYRAGAVAGAAMRAMVRRGAERDADRNRVLLYLRGPVSALAARESSSVPAPPPATSARPGESAATDARSLRVVHVVCTDTFAGVERHVVNVATGLAARGCDVVVIGGHREQMPRELTPAGVTWYAAASVGAAMARLGKLGRADVVHAHMSDAELAAALSLPSTRAAVVTTRHFAQRRGSSPGARALGALAPYVIREQLAISRFVAETIDGCSAVILPGVPNIDDPARPEDRELVVLMVQRLADEKMTEVGIEAFARSDLGRRGWRLEIAGSGPAEARLRRLADRLGLEDSCDFLGQRFDVEALCRRAGIFLAPCPVEAFGLSVLEAMSQGTPVVAAHRGGHVETVGCASDPALFAPGDADDAAYLLRELADDEDRRVRYGTELRAIQQDRFGTSRQVDEILAVYRRVTA